MSRGERVARLETLARAIGNAAAPSSHVGSFGMTAAAVHPRAVAVGLPASIDRSIVKLILSYRLGMWGQGRDGSSNGLPHSTRGDLSFGLAH